MSLLFDALRQFLVSRRDCAHHFLGVCVAHGLGFGQNCLGARPQVAGKREKLMIRHFARPPNSHTPLRYAITSWVDPPRYRHFFGCSETFLLRFHGMPQASRLTPTPCPGFGTKDWVKEPGARGCAPARNDPNAETSRRVPDTAHCDFHNRFSFSSLFAFLLPAPFGAMSRDPATLT